MVICKLKLLLLSNLNFISQDVVFNTPIKLWSKNDSNVGAGSDVGLKKNSIVES